MTANTTEQARAGEDTQLLLRLYSEMVLGRALEDQVQALGAQGVFRGFFHPGRGQEAVPAGACTALNQDDYLFYAHRGLTYLTAKGMDPASVLGDFHGRVGGSTGGLGAGTVHCIDPSHGIMGQGGTLGSCFTLSAGLGLASQLKADGRVTMAFFGEGASARGTFLEAGVTAVAWQLPIVWVCENNGWAVSAKVRDVQGVDRIAPRAAGIGFRVETVDGQDVEAVHQVATAAVTHARSGRGPVFIEAMTTRALGHYTGDMQPYRDAAEVTEAKGRDPITLAAAKLRSQGISQEELDRRDTAAKDHIAAADEVARSSPKPNGDRIWEGLWT